MQNCMLPPVHVHYWNSSTGKFSSILHTVPTLHQVIIMFLHPKKSARRPASNLFQQRHTKAAQLFLPFWMPYILHQKYKQFNKLLSLNTQ